MAPVRILVWACPVIRRTPLVAGLATFLVAGAAHAHHPGGDADGGLGWLWLFLGVGLLLAGIAAWAFGSGGPEDAEEADDEGGSPG